MRPFASPIFRRNVAAFFVARRRRGWTRTVALLLALSSLGLSLSSQAQQADRWKRGHPAVGQFRTLRFGPNTRPPAALGPNRLAPNELSVGANARAATVEPEQRREAIGAGTEARPGEFERPGLNPAERERTDLLRPNGNPRGPGPQGVGQRGPFTGSFSHRALTGRAGQGPSGFGRRGLAGRFQPRVLASLVPRRPLIGERGFTGVPPAGETRFLTNEMVFHVPPNVSPQTVDNVARRLGLSTIASHSFALSGGTLFRFRITDGRPVADVIRALESENIGVAQPNYVFRLQDAALAARNSNGDPTQYVVEKLRLVDLHRIAIGSNVLVAVIDSEIDARHPELAGAVVDEFDAIGNHDKPHVHGTGMAGAIAAHRKLIGVAPGVRVLAVHAFSSNGTDSAQATSEHILAGIDWAISKGAKIINMSFAGPDDPMMQLALQKARDKGIVLIAAAGNMGPKSTPLYPAADPNVIAVTATDINDQLLPQANQGPYVAVAAPGVNILEPAPNATYQVTTGTSVAAAHVSGIVALLLDRDPNLSADAIRDLLTSSARHHTPKGRDDQFGYGVVDPYRALMAVDAKIASERPKEPVTSPTASNARPITAR